MRNKGEKSVRWLVWSIAFLTLFILGLFGYFMSKEIHKKKQVESEINSLKEQAHKIEKENMALEERISYLGSKDYQEIQAKDKLNLRSPDENVVVIAQSPTREEKILESNEKKQKEDSAKIPNYQKWFDYFFR